MKTERYSRAGFTLLELVIAGGISIILFLTIGSLTHTATYTMDHLSKAQQVEHHLKKALRELVTDVKTASTAGFVIQSPNADYDVITLQVPDPGNTTGNVTYGYFDSSGSFQTAWSAQYRVENGSLVRRILNSGQTPVGDDAVLCTHIDLPSNSGQGEEKGFDVSRNGPLVDVSIRVRIVLRDGNEYVREERTTVLLVNS